MSDTTETVHAVALRATIAGIVDDALNSAIPEPWEVAEHAVSRIMAALTAAPAPAVVYDEDRRVEVIERDVPVVWRRAAGGAIEYALDMETREIIGARIFLPPAPAVGEPGEQYRFLDNGEIIASGDECPSDDCSRWEPVNRWAVGSPRSSIFKVIRRRITHPSEAIAAMTKRAEEAERERDEHAGYCAEAIEQRAAAEARIEEMGRALDEAVEYVRDGVNAQARNLHDVDGYPKLMAREQKTLDACLADLRLVETAITAIRSRKETSAPAAKDGG